MKKFWLYDHSTTYTIIGGLVFIYILCLSLCGFFIYKFIIHDRNESSVYILLAVLLIPLVIIPIAAHRQNMLSRYLIRCNFDVIGIHCRGLFWGKFSIPWESIHTYGVQSSSYSYQSFRFLYFSTKKAEIESMKEIAMVTKDRLVFQYRESIWNELKLFMPKDINNNLKDALDQQQNKYYKR